METNHSLAMQSWSLYALAVSIVFARVAFRRIMLKSFKDLQTDDWMMIALLIPFTASIALINLVSHRDSQLYRTYRYVLEELQIITIWLVKACLLILYWRIFPVAFSVLRRRYVQIVSVFCVFSFILTQASLLSWCQPSAMENNPQCWTHHNHTIISLGFSTLTTLLVLIIPTSFIPTPRRLLLAILIALGIMALVFSVLARYSILKTPEAQTYLSYYAAESTLLIVFANLPFLASLVVSTAPARLHEFGRNISFAREGGGLPLSQWPRSARMSTQSFRMPPLRTSRPGSMATYTTRGTERKASCASAPVTRPLSVFCGVDHSGRRASVSGWPLP